VTGAPRKPWASAAVLAAALLALDLVTKHYAALLIHPYDPIEVLPFFNLVNVQNRGAAFGMFHEFGNLFFVSVSVGAICLILWLMVKGQESVHLLAVVLSGALGNLHDRVRLGYVRDFLDFHAADHHWPAFNVADCALTIGLALLIALPLFAGRGQGSHTGDDADIEKAKH
jgi:signal peptidase II